MIGAAVAGRQKNQMAPAGIRRGQLDQLTLLFGANLPEQVQNTLLTLICLGQNGC